MYNFIKTYLIKPQNLGFSQVCKQANRPIFINPIHTEGEGGGRGGDSARTDFGCL